MTSYLGTRAWQLRVVNPKLQQVSRGAVKEQKTAVMNKDICKMRGLCSSASLFEIPQ